MTRLRTFSLWFSAVVITAQASPINYVDYHVDRIPNIPTAVGIVSEIIFEEDEVIEAALFGFDDAWESQIVNSNVLVFKPKDPEPETNLLVHTNKRHYIFTLTVGNNEWTKNPTTSRAIFSMRMRYSDAKSIKTKRANEAKELHNREISGAETYKFSNYDYRATPYAKDITPVRMWDNGTLTFVAFPVGSKRGAIYEIDSAGKNRLVNSHVEKNGLLVVHGVYDHMVIRLDDEAVEIRRNTVGGQRENYFKSNVPATKRSLKDDAQEEFKEREAKPQDPIQSLFPVVPVEGERDEQ